MQITSIYSPILGLFNDTFSCWAYVASDDKMVSEH
jgi:hypothetical protein